MNARRYFFIVTNLFLVLILAACNLSASGSPAGTKSDATATKIIVGASTAGGPGAGTTPGAGEPPSSGSGGCANPYYPVISGATWAYASTGSVAGDYSYTRSITGISDTGFTASDDFSAGVIRTTHWRCEGGSLTMLDSGSGSGIVSNTGLKVTVDSVTATGYIIPANFAAGNTWSEALDINTTNESNGEKKGTAQSVSQTDCTAEGPESVTVPAGTFDAVKISCHGNQVATVTLVVGGSTGPVTTIQDSIEWYALGVGLVQKMDSGDAGNETIQLTSYSIP